MIHRKILVKIFIFVFIFCALAGVHYFWKQSQEQMITNFEECAAAGNAIMESYPAQCRTEGGKLFVQEVDPIDEPLPPQDQVLCTLDAKICPDGTGVGRIPPNCEFAPCP